MEQNAEDYKNIMNSLLDVTSLERNSLTNLVKLYDVFNLFTSIRGRKNLENLQDFILLSKINKYFQINDNRFKPDSVKKQELESVNLTDSEIALTSRLFGVYQQKKDNRENLGILDVFFCLVGERSLRTQEKRKRILTAAKPYEREL